jgi:hypothetical protein
MIDINNMKTWCNYCDPKYNIIYGFCSNCKRRCYPPIFNKDIENIDDYYIKIEKWNRLRSDLVIDEMRRRENDIME